MIETRGIVEDVERRPLKEGYEYALVTIDGQRYEVRDSALYDQLLEGAEINYHFRRTADNRLVITDIIDSDEDFQEDFETDTDYREVPPHLATAYFALHAAIETVGDRAENYNDRLDKILATARRYRTYLEESGFRPNY